MINFLVTSLCLYFIPQLVEHCGGNWRERGDVDVDRSLSVRAYLNETEQVLEHALRLGEFSFLTSEIRPSSDWDASERRFFAAQARSDTQSAHYLDTQRNIVSSCTSIDGSDRKHLYNSARKLVEAYDPQEWTFTSVPLTSVGEACVVLAVDRQIAWIFADIAGTTPIFYALHDSFPQTGRREAVLTTDLLLARQLGFEHVTGLGAAQIAAIDMRKHTIHFIRQRPNKHGRVPSLSLNSSTFEDFSELLIHAAVDSVRETQPFERREPLFARTMVSEIDEMYWASKLLDCALDKLQVERLVRVAVPLVLEPALSRLPPRLQALARE